MIGKPVFRVFAVADAAIANTVLLLLAASAAKVVAARKPVGEPK